MALSMAPDASRTVPVAEGWRVTMSVRSRVVIASPFARGEGGHRTP